MAGLIKHDWQRIFATLRADGWTPTTEGKTSLRKHAEAFGLSPGTLLPKVAQERAKAATGLLAAPTDQSRRKRPKPVDPDAD